MAIFASYTGPDFLAFYAVMLVTCVGLGLWLPAYLRPVGRKGSVEDMEEVAVLVGGAQQHSVAVLSDLFAQGALTEIRKGELAVARTGMNVDRPGGDAGRAVLAKVGAFKLSEVHKTLKTHAKRIEARLVRRGLMIAREERWQLRGLSVLPYIALFVIGLYRQQAGDAAGEATGFLIGVLVLTVFLGIMRMVKFNNRTVTGNLLVRELEEQGSRLKRAPQASEAGYAVAIFGTGVLVGTPWEPVHAMRQAGSGDTSTSSDGSGDGGGCGGGCGGCGG